MNRQERMRELGKSPYAYQDNGGVGWLTGVTYSWSDPNSLTVAMSRSPGWQHWAKTEEACWELLDLIPESYFPEVLPTDAETMLGWEATRDLGGIHPALIDRYYDAAPRFAWKLQWCVEIGLTPRYEWQQNGGELWQWSHFGPMRRYSGPDTTFRTQYEAYKILNLIPQELLCR